MTRKVTEEETVVNIWTQSDSQLKATECSPYLDLTDCEDEYSSDDDSSGFMGEDSGESSITDEAVQLIEDALLDEEVIQEGLEEDQEDECEYDIDFEPAAKDRSFLKTVGITVKYGTTGPRGYQKTCQGMPGDLRDCVPCETESDNWEEGSFLSPQRWWHNVSGVMDASVVEFVDKMAQSEIFNGSAEGFVLTTAAATSKYFSS